MAVGEAAHFVVEATGTLYQVLDLAHGALRGGALQQDEVRIMSGNSGGSHTLVEILKSHYGTLEIEQIDLSPISNPTEPRPGTAPGTEP